MKANIYALADPKTSEVRYVGGWRHHSSIQDDDTFTERSYPAEVTAWIESLRPLEPITVHLESVRFDDERPSAENDALAAAVEQKWLEAIS